jgi:hypothetical protein
MPTRLMHQALTPQFADRCWITASIILSEDARRRLSRFANAFFKKRLAPSRSRVWER